MQKSEEVRSYMNDLIVYHSEIEDQDFQKVSIKLQTKVCVSMKFFFLGYHYNFL